ncbi:50S ribosomal protein L24 [Candidatus Wolfebacteria bacterium]|nr:50S ribosomal protein L24 [Candidatus Wolfebacteria bacterium]
MEDEKLKEIVLYGKVFPQKNKVLIEGLNLYKKHVRPKQQGEKGQTVLVPRAIDVSNVMLVCPSCSRAVRAGYRVEEKKKTRYCKRCGSPL